MLKLTGALDDGLVCVIDEEMENVSSLGPLEVGPQLIELCEGEGICDCCSAPHDVEYTLAKMQMQVENAKRSEKFSAILQPIEGKGFAKMKADTYDLPMAKAGRPKLDDDQRGEMLTVRFARAFAQNFDAICSDENWNKRRLIYAAVMKFLSLPPDEIKKAWREVDLWAESGYPMIRKGESAASSGEGRKRRPAVGIRPSRASQDTATNLKENA